MIFAKKLRLYKLFFLIGLLILMLSIILATNVGVANISFKQTACIIISRIPLVGSFISLNHLKATSIIIILKLRLPRILLAALVGMGLSVVGAAFQGIFKNPMADPFILGVSSGAALGATLGIVLNIEVQLLGLSVITIFAFLGAIATTLFVYNMASFGAKLQSVTLLLAGTAVSYLLSAIISLLMTFNRDNMERIFMWTMGSFSVSSWNQVIILMIVILPATVILCLYARDLNIMLIGEESARTLGVEVHKLRKIILIISTIIVAVSVSVSGIIGFVGLIIPHAVRLVVGSDNRVVMPFSALSGAVFLIFCDTIARTVASPSEIPVGIITSIAGVPFFIYLLYKSKRKVF